MVTVDTSDWMFVGPVWPPADEDLCVKEQWDSGVFCECQPALPVVIDPPA